MRFKIIQQLSLGVVAAIVLLTDPLNSTYNAQQQKPTPAKEKPTRITSHLVLISISGLRADHINDPTAFQLNIPNIQSLRNKGSYAVGVESVYPSQSAPAHASIVTGVLPADHGVTSDFAFDEQSGTQLTTPRWLTTEMKSDTLWAAAKREGLVTAAIGFPLTAGATIDFNLPVPPGEKGGAVNPPDARKYSTPPELFDHLMSASKSILEVGSGTKQKAVLQSSDIFKTEAAAYLIENNRPNLLMINFTAFDNAQRRFGLSSPEAKAALALTDTLVQEIVTAVDRAKLAGSATLFIVSDHGSSKIDKEFRPNVLLSKKGFLKVNREGKVESWRALVQAFGGSAAVRLKNPQDELTAREVETLFNELDQDSESPLWRITTHREAVRLGADPKASMYLDAAPQYKISARATGPMISKTDERAAHGYLPSRAEMRAVLIVARQGIKPQQKVEYARLVDIAPTVARLLGLELKIARGRVLSEIIAQ